MVGVKEVKEVKWFEVLFEDLDGSSVPIGKLRHVPVPRGRAARTDQLKPRPGLETALRQGSVSGSSL